MTDMHTLSSSRCCTRWRCKPHITMYVPNHFCGFIMRLVIGPSNNAFVYYSQPFRVGRSGQVILMLKLVPAAAMLETACLYLQLKLHLRGFCSLKTTFPPFMSVSTKERKDPSSNPENLRVLISRFNLGACYCTLTLLFFLCQVSNPIILWETGT